LASWIDMLKPPLGAGAYRLTVHVADACDASAVGLQVSPVSEASRGRGGGGTSVSAKFCEVPFKLATSTTVVLALTVKTFTVNPALVDPAAAITDEGIVTLPDPPPNPIVSPPLGTTADKVTMHEAELGVVTVAGVQASEVTAGGGGTSASEKLCEVPFRLATSITVVLALTVEAFSVNPALFDPAAIVTDEGTVTLAAPPVPVVTVSPPVGAGADIVTVHEAEPGVVTVAGVQARALTVNGGLMITCPPIAVTLKELLLAVAALTLRIWIVEDVLTVVGETVNVAVATTPWAMVVALSPNNKQV
jgi:hypothetical protein